MYKTLVSLVYNGELYDIDKDINIVEKDVLQECLEKRYIKLVEENEETVTKKTKKDK